MSDPLLILGLSRDPDVLTAADWSSLLARSQAEMAQLAPTSQPIRSLADERSALLGVGPLASALSHDAPGAAVVVPTAGTLIARDGSVATAGSLAGAELEHQLSRLHRVVPPFGFIGRDGASAAVVAGTDVVGLRHIYVAGMPGAALVSTSSSLLARLTRSPLDETAWSVLSQIGCLLGSRTMFRDVRKLDPAEDVRLSSGRIRSVVRTREVPTAVRARGWFTTEREAVETGAAELGAVIESFSRAHPHALHELSGGLDSRLVLALALRHHAGPVRTLSIGAAGSEDLRIAQQLVALEGLEGGYVSLSAIEHPTDAEVLAGVLAAARHRDFASNPLSGYVYGLVAAMAPTTAQVTGQAGELARGKYYAGQRDRRRYDRADATRLIRWREVLNQQVGGSIFSPDFREQRGHHLQRESWPYFDAPEGRWPAVSDHWYVFGRNQRLAGSVYSPWHDDHQHLVPFFHPDFVEWASRLPVHLKRRSRAFVSLLDHLSPRLARHPLDSGLTPRQAAGHGRGSRTQLLRRDVGRLRHKVSQRLSGQRVAPVRADHVADMALRALRPELLATLSDVAWLDRTALTHLQAGGDARPVDSVTAAFLINLVGAVDLLHRPAAPVASPPRLSPR